MTEKNLLLAESIAKENGFTGKDFSDFMHGFAEGVCNFAKTIDSDPYREGYNRGKKEGNKAELEKTRRRLENKVDRRKKRKSI